MVTPNANPDQPEPDGEGNTPAQETAWKVHFDKLRYGVVFESLDSGAFGAPGSLAASSISLGFVIGGDYRDFPTLSTADEQTLFLALAQDAIRFLDEPLSIPSVCGYLSALVQTIEPDQDTLAQLGPQIEPVFERLLGEDQEECARGLIGILSDNYRSGDEFLSKLSSAICDDLDALMKKERFGFSTMLMFLTREEYEPCLYDLVTRPELREKVAAASKAALLKGAYDVKDAAGLEQLMNDEQFFKENGVLETAVEAIQGHLEKREFNTAPRLLALFPRDPQDLGKFSSESAALLAPLTAAADEAAVAFVPRCEALVDIEQLRCVVTHLCSAELPRNDHFIECVALVVQINLEHGNSVNYGDAADLMTLLPDDRRREVAHRPKISSLAAGAMQSMLNQARSLHRQAEEIRKGYQANEGQAANFLRVILAGGEVNRAALKFAEPFDLGNRYQQGIANFRVELEHDAPVDENSSRGDYLASNMMWKQPDLHPLSWIEHYRRARDMVGQGDFRNAADLCDVLCEAVEHFPEVTGTQNMLKGHALLTKMHAILPSPERTEFLGDLLAFSIAYVGAASALSRQVLEFYCGSLRGEARNEEAQIGEQLLAAFDAPPPGGIEVDSTFGGGLDKYRVSHRFKEDSAIAFTGVPERQVNTWTDVEDWIEVLMACATSQDKDGPSAGKDA